MEEKILTIDRVRFTGKWVEFWFIDGQIEEGIGFHAVCKSYMLWDAIEKAVISNGLKGLKLKWVKEIGSYNFGIHSFIS